MAAFFAAIGSHQNTVRCIDFLQAVQIVKRFLNFIIHIANGIEQILQLLGLPENR